MMTGDYDSPERLIQRVETLVAELEAADPACQAAARNLVRAVLDLHAAGLARIVEWLSQGGAAARAVLDACCRDDLVGHLLLLHDLHPKDLETRVSQALEKLRPQLHKSGGNVELLEVAAGTVRLHAQIDCNGDTAARAAFRSRIEQAVLEAAPDAEAIELSP
jgi:Fe-S cluster biogenesis protein NfuA